MWNDPEIQFLGMTPGMHNPCFKLTVKWQFGKHHCSDEFIPMQASSTGRACAHCNPVCWLLIIGLWSNVFVKDIDLCLLVSQNADEQARSSIRINKTLEIKPEMRNMPVILANQSTAQWGKFNNINIQPMTYKQAFYVLKRLAEHPLATSSGLTFYDLRRTFATFMMQKIPRDQLNLLMAIATLKACYQPQRTRATSWHRHNCTSGRRLFG